MCKNFISSLFCCCCPTSLSANESRSDERLLQDDSDDDNLLPNRVRGSGGHRNRSRNQRRAGPSSNASLIPQGRSQNSQNRRSNRSKASKSNRDSEARAGQANGQTINSNQSLPSSSNKSQGSKNQVSGSGDRASAGTLQQSSKQSKNIINNNINSNNSRNHSESQPYGSTSNLRNNIHYNNNNNQYKFICKKGHKVYIDANNNYSCECDRESWARGQYQGRQSHGHGYPGPGYHTQGHGYPGQGVGHNYHGPGPGGPYQMPGQLGPAIDETSQALASGMRMSGDFSNPVNPENLSSSASDSRSGRNSFGDSAEQDFYDEDSGSEINKSLEDFDRGLIKNRPTHTMLLTRFQKSNQKYQKFLQGKTFSVPVVELPALNADIENQERWINSINMLNARMNGNAGRPQNLPNKQPSPPGGSKLTDTLKNCKPASTSISEPSNSRNSSLIHLPSASQSSSQRRTPALVALPGSLASSSNCQTRVELSSSALEIDEFQGDERMKQVLELI